jgi:MSHA pilin protein MshD
MSMTRLRQKGFTLIELIIFIVVVGVGVAGILSVYSTVVKSSADPMVRKQALSLAESVLEEILQKEYANPIGGYAGTPDRTQADDVDDFKGLTATQIAAVFADSLLYVPGTTINITVEDAAQSFGGGVDLKKVTVMVTRGAESISISGYRGNY